GADPSRAAGRRTRRAGAHAPADRGAAAPVAAHRDQPPDPHTDQARPAESYAADGLGHPPVPALSQMGAPERSTGQSTTTPRGRSCVTPSRGPSTSSRTPRAGTAPAGAGSVPRSPVRVGPGKSYVDSLLGKAKTRTEALRLLRRRLSDRVYAALLADEKAT